MNRLIFIRHSILLLCFLVGGIPLSGFSIERVSVIPAGTGPNMSSSETAISGDGRYVAYSSRATNIVSGDSNGEQDVFVYDRVDKVTTRVSVDSNGVEGNGRSSQPAISADGRYVAFTSTATNLVSNDMNGFSDVFVRDMELGTTVRASLGPGSVEGDRRSDTPDISADGRFVVFVSPATNFFGTDMNGVADVFVRDLVGNLTTQVSVFSFSGTADSDSDQPKISGDGRYVVFASNATNLTGSSDTNGQEDVFLRDRSTDTTIRLSEDEMGAGGNGRSFRPSISKNGSVVGFLSVADNLAGDDTNGRTDLFLYRVESGSLTRVKNGIGGAEPNGNLSDVCAFSGNGRFVGFSSAASNLVRGDDNGNIDVFVYDRSCGKTRLITRGIGGGFGSDNSFDPDLTDSGSEIAFSSGSANLIDDDFNSTGDAFVASVPNDALLKAQLLRKIKKFKKRLKKARRTKKVAKAKRLRKKMKRTRQQLALLC